MSNKIKASKDKGRIRLFFTGISMGAVDLVPGVSGGTMALLLGVYDELLYSIKLLTGKVPIALFKGQFKKSLRLIPFKFLVPLSIGMFVAIFGLVEVVSFLLESYPTLLWALFFGLILGSTYVVFKRVNKWTLKRYLILLTSFILTFIIVGLPSANGSTSPFAIFLTGCIAITAMILPGISGSLIMIILGQYEVIINAISERNIYLLSIFAIGAIIGLALFVRLFTWLLNNYHLSVLAFLIGIMAGSLRRIWPWQFTNTNETIINVLPTFNLYFLLSLSIMFLGFIIIVYLEKLGIAKDHDDIQTKDFQEESSIKNSY